MGVQVQTFEEQDLFLWEEEEPDVVCDYDDEEHNRWPVQVHGPAEWIVGVGAECVHKKTRLLCTCCKDTLMTTDGAMYCSVCLGLVAPARKTIRFIEPLNKR